MQRKLLALLIAVIMLFSMVSCDMNSLLEPAIDDGSSTTDDTVKDDGKQDDGVNDKQDDNKDDDKPDDKPVEDDEGEVIFSKKTSTTIILARGTGIDAMVLSEKIYQLTGKITVVNDDSMDSEGTEIVIGEVDRAISATAATLLEEYMTNLVAEYNAENKISTFLDGFLIYSTGKSVALVWTDAEYATRAFEYFVDNYVNDEKLSLEYGYCEFVGIDGVDDIISTQQANQAAAWAELEATYGAQMVTAVQNHLDMFDEEFYLWLASLYEKNAPDTSGNVLGGAFYYSNSAKNNTSYSGVRLLPDLESTSQVLTFLQKSGMLDGVGFTEAIPEEMRQQLIDFARALQSSEDGYFYHPQWGTSITSSRRSRDCSWGATILTRLGSKPYWNTPSGTYGIYGAPGSGAAPAAITGHVYGCSATVAASVVLAAESWTGMTELSTISAWESYLNSKMNSIGSNSYDIGNTLSSLASQIKNRERLAIMNGELSDPNKDGIADNGYIRTFERILNSKQCDNGLWETTVSYQSVNGLMKIAGGFSNLGLQIQKADKALEAAVSMVLTESTPNEITSVYNPWVAINTLLNNITNYGDAAKSAELRAMIQANAYEMLTTTTAHVAKFKKEDGSFGYTQDYVPYKSQGAIAAVRYTVEGDVNGGTIAFTGIWSSMTQVLEIDVLPFDFEDYLAFIAAVDYER